MSDTIQPLPHGWTSVPLSDVARPSSEKVEPTANANVPYVGLEHIESGTGRLLGHGYARDVRSTKAVFRRGDVLYGKLRPYLRKVWRAEFDGVCSTDILVYQCSPSIESGYLRYVLASEWMTEHAVQASSGINLPRVNAATLGDVSIPLAPIAEQRRIVTKLDELLAGSRAARAALEAVPALLEQYRQTTLAAAFRGDPTAIWRLAHPHVANGDKIARTILARREGRGRSRSANAYELPTPHILPAIPDRWAWLPVEALTEVGRPVIYGIIKPGPDTPGGVPYVRVTEMKSGTIDVSQLRRCHPDRASKFARASLRSGDVLVSKDGTIGKVAIVPPELEGGNITQHVLRVSPAHGVVPEYLALAIEAPLSQAWITGELKGIGLQGINVGDFRRLPIPVPCEGEQEQVVRLVTEQLSSLRRQLIGVTDATRALDQLEQAALSKALRGALVPQDPKDEPAPAMLARSRTARDTSAKPIRTLNPAASVKPPRARKNSAMTKSRFDPEIKGQPYLAGLLRESESGLSVEELFRRADLSLTDFYKQLGWEVTNHMIRDDPTWLQAF